MEIVVILFGEDPERERTILWVLFWLFALLALGVVLWRVLTDEGGGLPPSARRDDDSDAKVRARREREAKAQSTAHEKQGGPDKKKETWPRVPSEAEIGERASYLSGWREERGIEATTDEDWVLAERELFRDACGLPGTIERRAYYRGEHSRAEIEGIGSEAANELGRLGFPSPQSLAGIDSRSKGRVEKWMKARGISTDLDSLASRVQGDEASPDDEDSPDTARSKPVQEEDLTRIISSEFRDEDVEIRKPFGIVYKSKPATQDDLREINGVGPVLEKKLHNFGVYRFKQIANWPEAAIDEFQEQLSFPDRIRRDDWVGQCRRLARGEKGKK